MEVNDVTKYIMMSNNTEDLNHIKRMLQMTIIRNGIFH